eukprot:488491-Pleurochrysis_carterae.AAC.1
MSAPQEKRYTQTQIREATHQRLPQRRKAFVQATSPRSTSGGTSRARTQTGATPTGHDSAQCKQGRGEENEERQPRRSMRSSGIALLWTHTANAGAVAEGQGGAARPGVVARRTGRHLTVIHSDTSRFDYLGTL